MNSTRPAAAAMHLAVTLTLLLCLSACGTRQPAQRPGADGGPSRLPPNLDQVPDAVPRVEPLRSGGPNKPYEVFGQRYVPLPTDLPLHDSGGASWYGRKFHGQPTASGEPYDMFAMTAAHKTMPIPSYARVRNPANGREVIVRINDRGPFAAGRVIDLSYTAALKLGVLGGVAPVQVQRLTHAEIRAGSPWPDAAVAAAGVLATGQTPAPKTATLATAASSVLAPDDPALGDVLLSGPGIWLQFGAFRARDPAVLLHQRVLPALLLPQDAADMPASSTDAVAVAVAIVAEDGLFRVQAGPFATRAEAQAAADRLRRQAGVAAVLVERAPAPRPSAGRP